MSATTEKFNPRPNPNPHAFGNELRLQSLRVVARTSPLESVPLLLAEIELLHQLADRYARLTAELEAGR